MDTTYRTRAGLFVVITLTLFVVSIFVLGKERQIFASQEEYYTSFADVGGLVPGAPVRLGGITVGRVSDIAFGNDPADSTVYVRFLVNSRYLERIRKESYTSIQTQGLLGDKYLGISGSEMVSSEPLLKPGSYIKSKASTDFGQVLAKAQEVVDNTVDISRSVKDVLDTVKEDTIKSLTESASGVANITKQIIEGDGFAHRLLYSKNDADKILDSLGSASGDISKIMKQVRKGEGLLHALIFDPQGKEFVSNMSLAANQLSKTSQDISKLAEEVENGSGLAHELVYGDYDTFSKDLQQTVANLNKTADSLKQAADALANGEGTIGALLVDSKLYDNLVEVTDGAKRSYLLKKAIQSALKDKS